MMTFEDKVTMVLEELKHTLISKNKKYGNSALEPVRVFSKASPKEQILVRLDDKLSRLRTQHISEDEDVATDLMGYLVLLKIADMQTPLPSYENTELTYEDHVNGQHEIEVREMLRNTAYYVVTWEDDIIFIGIRGGENGISFNNYEEFMEWYNTMVKDEK